MEIKRFIITKANKSIMFEDIVFPEENEEEFIEIALKLGYSKICFVYPIDRFSKNKNIKNTKIIIDVGILAKPNEIIKAKRLSDFVVVRSSEDNRHVIEKLKPNLIFDLETEFRKDFVHHRASGLNQVLCRFLKENNIAVGFSFSTILNSNAKILGRISQNIKLCRKYHLKTAVASFARDPFSMRAPSDLTAFFTCLGMHPSEAKSSLIQKFK